MTRLMRMFLYNGAAIVKSLDELSKLDAKTLIKKRRDKFLDIGRSLM